MKIRKVATNNRKRAFEVTLARRTLTYPYAKCELQPGPGDQVAEAWVDSEIGREGFGYRLGSGKEGLVHVEQVLEYNRDPDYLAKLLLYKLSLVAQERIVASPLSKREVVRRLGTSATQLYRLLDPTNYRKSFGQLLSLLHVLDCDVDLVIRKRKSA